MNRIEKLYEDIENYKEAIENAQGALEETERELIEEIEARAAQSADDSIEDYPEYDKD